LKSAGLRSRILLQVHDELLLECPMDEVEAVKAKVTAVMESAIQLRVPLVVNVGVGSNWAEL
jgi:DNA polymerase-1